ncbi:MAG: phosphoribosylamine--glycine ligase [Acidobacteriia bacterium]|nr:phosphoribosylamine--glycine ligase [Terriglobia bacterium]
MRILVVGSGGREHALVWKLRRSARVHEILCAPGNGGIEEVARCLQVSPLDQAGLLELAGRERVDLVLVGPEAPLAAGLADGLRTHGIAVLGPSQAAARLESSKVFAKEFMARHGIPTAGFTIHSQPQEALSRLASAEIRYPLVVKADGLAAGKGVVVARSREEARRAIESIMIERQFGAAGDRIVLEEFLEGKEASFIVFTDGDTILPAAAAQDHKAVYDHDMGPNTGGMGAYSTDTILGPELQNRILAGIVRPVIDAMQAEGAPFQGILYTGLMLTSAGPRVLEFNVRMGDPEGQVILPRLTSDFAELCEALCLERLNTYRAVWTDRPTVCVVLASEGYPGAYPKGKPISGLKMAEEDDRVVIFHSGTRHEGRALVTDGGRVLGVTALADDLSSAVMAAYEAVNRIYFEGMHYRRDIGAKGLIK